MINALQIHTDGGARGNPGPAAIGVVIETVEPTGSKKGLTQFGKKIGETTNNVAEYQAVYAAFTYLEEEKIVADHIAVYLDSQLVASQLTGIYKIKMPHLQELWARVKNLERKVGKRVVYFSIPRAQNAEADKLVNQALDSK